MLDVELSSKDEERVFEHAHRSGQPPAALVRSWIEERLAREDLDRRIAEAAVLLAATESDEDREWHRAMAGSTLRAVDQEDGGYDWGSDGPPSPQ